MVPVVFGSSSMATVQVSEAEKVYILHGIRVGLISNMYCLIMAFKGSTKPDLMKIYNPLALPY